MKLGRYEIERELGQGAMGTVYLAKDTLLKRQVALKTIKHGTGMTETDQKSSMERFFREARAAAILSHPNIVTIYDLGRDEATQTDFIAMEYVPGRTLDSYFSEKGGPLDFHEAVRIIQQVAKGIDCAHNHGIIHRDIKPSNILVKVDGTVKIMDFGIARLTESVTLTQTGGMVGTPAYMSPEQVLGNKVDGRSDIFSLGVVFYEVLTGKRPFESDSFVTLAYKILNEQPEPADLANPLIPKRALAILEKCLEKNPDFRYQKASHLAQALETLLPGAAARSQGAAETLIKTVRPPEPQKNDRPAPAPKKQGNPFPAIALLLLVLAGGSAFWYFKSKSATTPPATKPPITLPVEKAPPIPKTPAKPSVPSPTLPAEQEKIFDSKESKTATFKEKADEAFRAYQNLPEKERYQKVNQVIASKFPERFKVAFLKQVLKSDPSPRIRQVARKYLDAKTSSSQ